MRKNWSATFKIKVTARAYIIKISLFLLYLLTFCSCFRNQTWIYGTSLLARVFCEKLDCCVQGRGHSKGSKCQWMIVCTISSEPPNILLPDLAWWCIIKSRNVGRKKLVRYLQGQGHGEDSYDLNMTASSLSFKLILLQPSLLFGILL